MNISRLSLMAESNIHDVRVWVQILQKYLSEVMTHVRSGHVRSGLFYEN